MTTGKVYLVGAGPGDPNLITVKGMECLKQADVIIYDRLIDDRLLEATSETAERIYVGKSREKHTLPQNEINQLLVAKAKDGRTVVRLKGGDSFVLGRGGEETETLAHHHIPFEVVPGVSSAVAAPAYAGIPVTHRGLASSFTVIAGHEDPNKKGSSIDWEKLARGTDTLVFLMGVRNLPKIVDKLQRYGRPVETPVAMIMNGTRPDQKTITGCLADIVLRTEKEQSSPPAVIIVGDVVKLREKLRWFDNRPLSGKRVLVTRARQQTSTLSQLLADRGAQPIELPAITFQDIDDNQEFDHAIINIGNYHWLVFTSANGVDAFFKRLHNLKLDTRALKNIKIGTIGPTTTRSLEKQGIIPDYLPEIHTSLGILDGLRNQPQWHRGQRFLLPHADIADNELAEGLRQMGAEVKEVDAYRTVPTTEAIAYAKEMLLADKIDVITFTSSSTVSNLVAAFRGEKFKINRAKIACIGSKTAATADGAGLKVNIIAREATIPSLVTAIEEYFVKEI
ncbi:MAG: uroporphyrinogen-III C-methyltransferase [Dehalococcoidales bacterium]|jgi:uroporphyrinogen III methyltransferase/synthase|nr:uroporphyrinogen-III C-methyltransferase [Dehalococcoidales bacterium]MDP6737500.1 uroporphyrinogen-III C-methyltransferase [Dehalococcoidales bacterium]